MKLRISDANSGEVRAILHRQRRVIPTIAVAEQAYGVIFGIQVCAEIAAHPGFVEHCAPAQEFVRAGRALPAGVIAAAACWPAENSTANALQYATNCARLAADEAAEKAAESPQASLDL